MLYTQLIEEAIHKQIFVNRHSNKIPAGLGLEEYPDEKEFVMGYTKDVELFDTARKAIVQFCEESNIEQIWINQKYKYFCGGCINFANAAIDVIDEHLIVM